MLGTLRTKALKGYVLRPAGLRPFSGAAAIKDRFESAWLESQKSRTTHVKEPKNKEEYGSGYVQRHSQRIKKGYSHPYHSRENPLLFTSVRNTYETLSNLVGPEQVSPHYESIARSRRGIIFMTAYIGAIVTITRLGGFEHNEWVRGLIFHAEYLMCMYIGYIEIRHFTWLPGPKFTPFYDIYSRYECQQLAAQWNDAAEELQQSFYQNTREQIEYMRIHNEYQFIKKRSLINFLTNERLNLEKHFHDRTLNMLSTISNYEQQNLRNKLSSITQESFEATLQKVENDEGGIKQKAFAAALAGIRKGQMSFDSDPVLPILVSEIESRTSELKNLTAEEESKLLSLKADQKKSVAQMDKAAKEGYLSAIPHITSQGLKSHEKFQRFADYLTNINRKDVA